MEWVRGETIGRGCFGKVDKAIVTKAGVGFPPLMAVKSAPVYNSESLKNEKEILGLLGNDSDYVIRCFGDSCSTSSEENDGERVYNVFLEYADGGSLFDRVRNCGGGGGGGGGGLSESEVRSYTRSVLKGLNDVHSNGFVHCDVKLQNILLCSSEQNGVVAKIADFGLAKRQRRNRAEGIKYDEFRGTPLYMSPETAVTGECESPADIWAVGCAVVEMLTGARVWKNESNIASLLLKIAKQSPELPQNLSLEIRDFIEKCFIRDAAKRWTAEMLLNHPFIIETLNPNSSNGATKPRPTTTTTTSPKCPFDFPEFITPTPISRSGFESWIEKEDNLSSVTDSSSARFRQLVSEQVPEWLFTDSWLMVRH